MMVAWMWEGYRTLLCVHHLHTHTGKNTLVYGKMGKVVCWLVHMKMIKCSQTQPDTLTQAREHTRMSPPYPLSQISAPSV